MQHGAKKTRAHAAAAQNYAKGGMVRGKGTGTSDEVPDVVPEGTYIMPADSTKALGAKGLANMGAPGVPVNLSNGEFKMPPEQVHAVGVQALDQMKGATHTPVGAQAPAARARQQPPKPELFFANGGLVDDNEVTRAGNSYSGGNVGGSISINGQAPAGTVSSIAAQPAPAVAPVVAPPAPAVAATPPTAPATAGAAAPVAGAPTPAAALTAPAATPALSPLEQRNAAVAANSITRNGGRFDSTPSPTLSPTPAAVPEQPSINPDPLARKPLAPVQGMAPLAFGFRKDYADGGVVEEEKRRAQAVALAQSYGLAPAGPGDASRLARVPAGIGGNQPNAAPPAAAPPVARPPAMVSPMAAMPVASKNPGLFPGNSPDAGANVYGGAGKALGTSGLLATGAERVIAAQPPVAQPAAVQPAAVQPRPAPATGQQIDAMVSQIPRDAGPVSRPPAAAPANLETQIPTGGPVAPAADGSQNNPMNSSLGRNVSNTVMALPGVGSLGRVAATAGAFSRGVGVLDAGAGLAATSAMPQPSLPMAQASAAPVQGAIAPVAPVAPPAVAGQPPAVAAPIEQPAAQTQAPAPDGPAEPVPGVYRQGNSYSDSVAGLSGTNTGQPSAQNMAAAQALSDSGQQQALARGFGPTAQAASSPRVDAPQISHSGNSWQARNDLRNARVSASSITENGGRFDKNGKAGSAAAATYAAMLSNDMALRGAQPGADLAAMRENAANGRFDSQQQNENMRSGARNQIDNQRVQIEGQRVQNEKGRYDLEGRAKGFDIRQAERMEGLQNEYLAAQNDPNKAEGVLKKIQDLSGKTSDPAARYTAVSGGQEWDAQAGAMRNVPGRVLNNKTGQWVQDGPAPAQAPIGQNPKALAIKNDTKMTTEQKRAALAQLGY